MRKLLLEFDRAQSDSPPILVQVSYDTEVNRIIVTEDYVEVTTGLADNPYADKELAYWFCNGPWRVWFRGLQAFPYAERIENQNEVHTWCNIGYNNLQITLPVKTTLATNRGSFNGTATIEVTGNTVIPPHLPQTHRLGYSLDNKKWQYTPTFINLKVGQYTVYVREENTNVAPELWHYTQANFTISYRKIYSSRFYLNFLDEQQDNPTSYRLNISGQNISVPAKKICGGASPVVIQYPETEDKYEVVKGSSCNLELLEEKQFQFLSFYSSDERQHRVDVWEGNNLYWRGYILPEQYNWPFLSPPYFIQVQATDGLGTLKKYPYLDKDGNKIEGERTEIDVIFDCLDKLELDIPVQSAIDLYEDSMFETTNVTSTNQNFSDPLFQAKINASNLVDDKGNVLNCDQVIRRVLRKYGARIYQSEGTWRIECIDAKRQAYWRVNWKSNRQFAGYEMYNPIISTRNPRQGGLIWVKNEQQGNITPAYKNTTVQGTFQVLKNVVPGGELNDADFTANNRLKNWAGSAPYARVRIPDKSTNAIQLSGASDLESAKYLQTKPIYLLAGDSLQISLAYNLVGNDGVSMAFQLFGAGSSLYYAEVNKPELAWKSYNPNLFVQLPVQFNTDTTYTAILPAVPADGNYTLRIMEPFAVFAGGSPGPLKLNSIQMGVLPSGENPLGTTSVTVTNPFAYTFSPEPAELDLLDIPKNANFRNVYGNYIVVSGSQSNGWHIKGQRTKNNPLISILATSIAYNHERPSHLLRGTLKGKYSFQNVIHEQYDLDRLFINDGLSIDIKKAQYQVTLRELIIPIIEPVEDGYGCGIELEDQTGFIKMEDNTGVILLESC